MALRAIKYGFFTICFVSKPFLEASVDFAGGGKLIRTTCIADYDGILAENIGSHSYVNPTIVRYMCMYFTPLTIFLSPQTRTRPAPITQLDCSTSWLT